MFCNDFPFIKMMFLMPDDLVILVSLAAENDHIMFFVVVDRPLDGLDAVRDDLLGNIFQIIFLQSLQNILNDRFRILGPGVVGSNDAEIGIFRTDAAHDGPFRPVAVAAAAKQCHYTPFCHRTQ